LYDAFLYDFVPKFEHMGNAPFIFGKLATQIEFTDREKETAHLASNFSSLVNTIILSPRRWGKTSLVGRVSELLGNKEPDLKICHIDLFNVRTEEGFYIALATEIIKATSTKWEERAQNAKEFLAQLLPRNSFSPDDKSEISFGVSSEDLQKKLMRFLIWLKQLLLKEG
jgi:AAA+ ATPase superfamily predicted ATPase